MNKCAYNTTYWKNKIHKISPIFRQYFPPTLYILKNKIHLHFIRHNVYFYIIISLILEHPVEGCIEKYRRIHYEFIPRLKKSHSSFNFRLYSEYRWKSLKFHPYNRIHRSSIRSILVEIPRIDTSTFEIFVLESRIIRNRWNWRVRINS